MAFLLLNGSHSLAQFFSQAVGSVDGEAITSREVELQFLVDRLLFSKRKVVNVKTLSIDKSRFNQEVTSTLVEIAVEKEARSFAVAEVKALKVEGLSQEFLRKVRGNTRWRYLDFSIKEVKVAIERKLRARRFLDFKKDSTLVPITDAESRAYFDENRLRFGSLPFENFNANIKRFLSTRKLNIRLQEWFELLRRKYKIRNLMAEKSGIKK